MHSRTRMICHDERMLTRLYTQNIDGLDFQTGLPPDAVVPVHGSLGTVSCEHCGAPAPLSKFAVSLEAGVRDIYGGDGPQTSSAPLCGKCGAPGVKPDTVLFGRQINPRFFELAEDDAGNLDVLFIAGTSLAVSPANSLPDMVGRACLCVAVNRDPIAGFNTDASGHNIQLQGTCDEVFLELASRLGWLPRLKELTQGKLPPESATVLANHDKDACQRGE